MELNNVQNYELILADGNTFRLDEEADVVIFNPPYFKSQDEISTRTIRVLTKPQNPCKINISRKY